MAEYRVVAEMPESTVVAEYVPEPRRALAYQSEKDLEEELLSLLSEEGYERLSFHTEAELVANLRKRLEILNGMTFTDGEWERFFASSLVNPNEHIREKAKKMHEDFVQVLRRDDGTSKNILLLDHRQIHNNYLQVIHQYEAEAASGARHDNRYDVTILVNGFPMVHIELKRRGVPIREAFHQIRRYQRDSFWSGCGLFEYVQIFVISNGTDTKYYSNTTRDLAVHEANAAKSGRQKASASFDFTSFWADAKNQIIPDLVDFAKTFLSRHTILSVLTRYCVFTSEELLLVMRPYQITATERILNRIEIANNYKKYGTTAGGGYIWHTTGSGKTLTSFKTARLASAFPFVDKVLFVVDRKDLDYQTMREYDRFEKGAADSNTSTAVLSRQLSDPAAKIIITTIQKLSHFIRKYPEHDVYGRHVVMIFDECHRSQFGDMHAAIVKHFKNYYLFGFTGTPIFAKDAAKGTRTAFLTTDQTFGDRLHVYTIVDAIQDHNVLPFRIDYIKTMDRDPYAEDKKVYDIDRERAFLAPERIRLVTRYILEHFDQKTYRNQRQYWHSVLVNPGEVAARAETEEIKEKRRVSGFNSIFCVASISAARLYYEEFQRQLAANPQLSLRVATIFSFAPNEAEEDGWVLGEENSESTAELSRTDRDFLDTAIADYNRMFGTNYSTDGDRFQNYYKDVSLRMKNKELDLLIVVNMFLTGFDAPTLNTLWVDKNLMKHGLIQAFSRTNRILNRVKAFGNIICFRNLQKKVDAALGLYGDRDAGGVVLIRSFKDYYEGFRDESGKRHPGYVDLVRELKEKFPIDGPFPVGEKNMKDFLNLFGAILRLRNLLLSFDEFSETETFSPRDFQDYLGRYQDVHDRWKEIIEGEREDPEDITEDVVFETELIRQLKIDVDYILMLVKKYHDSNREDAEILVTIRRAVEASPELRSKKDLVMAFIESLNRTDDVTEAWARYIGERREKELADLVTGEQLREKETRRFLEHAFREGEIRTTGTEIDGILPPMSRFGSGNREEKKSRVIDKLKAFLERFLGLGGPLFSAAKSYAAPAEESMDRVAEEKEI